jgi:hypothetical protein
MSAGSTTTAVHVARMLLLLVVVLATVCAPAAVRAAPVTVDPGAMLIMSNETDVEAIRRNQIKVLVHFRNDTHRFVFTSSDAIKSLAGHFAFGPGDGMTPAVSAYRRLQSLEPKDRSIVKYVFLFRKDEVGRVLDAYAGGQDAFFETVGILHMELYVQEPAARSAMAKSRVVTMYHFRGKEAPLHLNAFSWPLGLVLSLPVFVAFEVVASIYLKRGPSVIKGGKDTSLLGRWRRSRAKRRSATKGSGEPLPDDSYAVPEVRVDEGDLDDRDDEGDDGAASAVKKLQHTDPSALEYDRLCRLAVDDMSPADTGGSTPPFGFAEARHDASVEPLTVEGLPAARSAAASPAISPRTHTAPVASPRQFSTSGARLLGDISAASLHEL